jgi:hypothetical protein
MAGLDYFRQDYRYGSITYDALGQMTALADDARYGSITD